LNKVDEFRGSVSRSIFRGHPDILRDAYLPAKCSSPPPFLVAKLDIFSQWSNYLSVRKFNYPDGVVTRTRLKLFVSRPPLMKDT
jgi:hypothetical protein